jgi:hypothetical protein
MPADLNVWQINITCDVKLYQKEVLAESKAMVPDTTRRLKTAIEDLKSLMVILTREFQCLNER